MVFHARLGSLGDKVRRLEALAPAGRQACPAPMPRRCGARRRSVQGRSRLRRWSASSRNCRASWGVITPWHAGEPDSVATAIAEHYAPQGPGDRCPTAPTSVVDRAGRQARYACGFLRDRREADGLEGPVRVAPRGARRAPPDPREPPASAAAGGVRAGAGRLRDRAADLDREGVAAELLDFFADRLKVHLRDRRRAPRSDQRGVRARATTTT